MEKKYVYMFDEGKARMKELLGGKGAGLAEMTNLGLPVPPGFTITTEACNDYSSTQEVSTPAWRRRSTRPWHQLEQRGWRQELRRPQEPAARLRALRRQGLHAGHDGHDPQPRPERRDRRGHLATATGNARFA